MPRTEEEVLDTIRAAKDLRKVWREFADGDFADAMEACADEDKIGDPLPENLVRKAALRAVGVAMRTLGESIRAYIRATTGSLGRLAGAPDITNVETAVNWFQRYAVAESKAILSRGWTKSLSLSGSDADGTVGIMAVDPNGAPFDEGVPDVIEITCREDTEDGRQRGRELFQALGTRTITWPWEEAGTGRGNAPMYAYGETIADFQQPQRVNTGQRSLVSVTGAAGNQQRVQNGNFAGEMVGENLPNWNITAGAANLKTTEVPEGDLFAPDAINGARSLKAEGNFDMYQLLPRLPARKPYGVAFKVRPAGDGTVTGTLRVRIMAEDDSATYATITRDLTEGAVGTTFIATPQMWVQPATDKPIKIRVDLTGYGGTSSEPLVYVDDIVVREAQVLNGAALMIYDGTHRDTGTGVLEGSWRQGDVITYTAATADTGEIQHYYFNEGLGRYLNSAGSASTNWGDAPET